MSTPDLSGAGSPGAPPSVCNCPRTETSPRLGAGSWLLASAWQRMGAAVLVSAALWILTGWAMQWW